METTVSLVKAESKLPQTMNFTEAQQKAIDVRDCTLLIAAGAGSGKTRVLTERIVRMITDEADPADVSKLLVVTFTKAAANEMLVRIRAALADRLASGQCSAKETAALLRALAKLPTASISTIDSFCLDVVSANFEKLGIPPKVRLGMKNETDVLLRGVIDDLIEEKMGEKDEDPYFLTVYELLCGKKNDELFADTLLHFYQTLAGYPSITRFFDRAERYYEEIASENAYNGHYGTLLKTVWNAELAKAKTCIEQCILMCRGWDILEKNYLPAFEQDLEGLNRLLDAPHTSFADDAGLLAALRPGMARLKSAKGFEDEAYLDVLKGIREQAKTYAKQLTEQYFGCPTGSIRDSAEDMRHILHELRELVLTVDERFMERKHRTGMMEFSDLSRYVYSLVCDENGEPTETAKAISGRFTHIFIDEYQDVNPIQEGLLRAIARRDGSGAECSRFLVGDVKQSIYRFRGARPDIFEDCRRDFADIMQDGAPRKKLFMQHNFRCAEPVIDFTNDLFRRLMAPSYTDDDALVFAKRETCPVKEPVRLLLVGIPGEANAEVCLAAEMHVIADRIRSLVGAPGVVGENGKPYAFGDVAILTGKWKQAIALEAYLCANGIPAFCERGELLFERAEVRLAVNIMRAIDNPERDIPLAAFLRCAVSGFDDDELAGMRAQNADGSLHTVLRRYAASGDRDALRHKCAAFLAQLDDLRRAARHESASEFVRELYVRLHLESVVASAAFSNGPNDEPFVRRANLQRLAEIARDYDRSVFRGLSDFLDYIEGMFDDDTVKSAGRDSEGSVRVMTVHQSKGLEFPVCILFGMDSLMRDEHKNLCCSEQHGAALKLKNLPNIRSMPGDSGHVVTEKMPFRELIGYTESAEQMNETKRVLYVAVTRARDRLIISGCMEKPTERLTKALTFPGGCLQEPKTRLDLLLGCLADTSNLLDAAAAFDAHPLADDGRDCRTLPFLRVEAIPFDLSLLAEAETAAAEPQTAADDARTDEWMRSVADELARRADIVQKTAFLPPKMTVSQLKHGLLEYEDMADITEAARKLQTVPAFIAEEESLGAERGTAMHQFLQFADFAVCEKNGAAAAADALAEAAFITPRQRTLLDIPLLDTFFTTPLYARIRASRHVERELRFNLKESPANLLHDAPPTDDFILVQGVIDCFFENADGSYTVLDFKTDRVSGEAGAKTLIERYANQIRYYARAVREITGKEVSDAILFSFALMKEVRVEVDD